MVKFGIIGVVATLTHLCVALVLNEIFGIVALWSNFTAFLAAWPVSYLGNRGWTFNTNLAHQHSIPRFGVASLSGLLLSQLIVWFVADVMGYGLRLALVPALVIVPAFSFLANRYWVFPANQQSAVK